jgi:HNH endonuclease
MAERNYTKTRKNCELCGKRFSTADKRTRHCSRVCGGLSILGSLEERFLANLGRTTKDGCILWDGSLDFRGYGSIGNRGTKKAHRVAWELFVGPIPDGMCVLHKCDNPRCVAPAHLFLGTHADNVADTVAKNRHSRGEKNGHAKFTASDVKKIRKLAAMGVSYAQLAREYGVWHSAVRKAVIGLTWKHLYGAMPKLRRRRRRR